MADPISTTGLVLGIVPLLISAFENYEIIFQPFVTYCRHVKEVERFLARLKPQRTIFLNECELLFAAVSRGISLAEVIRDPSHASRNDEEISKRLEALLGASYSDCVLTLNLINDTLSKITLETKGFEDILEDKITRKAKGKSSWSLFRQKIKISFSKNRLNDTVDELRHCNEVLVTLSRQIRELATQRSTQNLIYTSSPMINHFKVVQKASTRLHDILVNKWSCDERIEHIASICLDVEDAEHCRHRGSEVRFSLALTCIPQNSVRRPDPLWLEIESAPSDPRAPQLAINVTATDPTATLQATLRSVGLQMPTKAGARNITSEADPTPQNVSNPNESQLNLHTIGRLCKYFQHYQNESTSPEPSMGFFEKTKTFKHFVYPSPTPRFPKSSTERSLMEILQEDFEEERQEPWSEKLNLAKLLALAVLRFHATPWLADSWSSNDISLHGLKEGTDDIISLSSPYLNVKLSTDIPRASQITKSDSNDLRIAPNPTLFSLGVTLIELGYDAPLRAMRREDDLRGGANNELTDYLTAIRLGNVVSKKLNTRYGRLVKKCLTCDFGVGNELESSELKSAVVVNIVKELDECLKTYNAFNLLAPALG